MSSGADYNQEEKKMAKRDGAVLVKNSGRGMRKGDARRDNLLIDYKFTAAKSFALNIDAFRKHERDAWAEGYDPCVVAVFSSHNDRTVAMVDWAYLKELQDEVQEYRKALAGE